MDFSEYDDFATPKQKEYINALKEFGSFRKAGNVLNVNESTVRRGINRLKKEATRRGFSPEHDFTNTVPEGYLLKGTSTLYDANNNIKMQWVKSLIDPEKQKILLEEFIQGFSEELPKIEPTKFIGTPQEDLANLYVLTDYHLGMFAWNEESGEDWDMKIAEELIEKWFNKAIDLAPDSKIGIFGQLGDFLHWDGLEAVTPAHKNILDADTRFQKVVRTAIRIIRRIMDKLLAKHEIVHVIIADANHDPAGSVWIREWLASIYENEPRVVVDTSADSYYCIEYGNTSLFFHHGHKKRVTNVDDVFVGKFREIYGRTKYAYAHLGHFHHVQSKETNLMIVEQHRTLAAKDAYSSRGGYLSGRDAKVITYSKEYGEVGRINISPEMVL